jgi:hypothetical protein
MIPYLKNEKQLTMDEGVTSQNLNQLEPSFMYTQISKENLLPMKYSKGSIKDFIQCWRHYCVDDESKLKVIAEFERSTCVGSYYDYQYGLFYLPFTSSNRTTAPTAD